MKLPRNAHLWLPGYVASAARRARHRKATPEVVDVMFCIADHFEPDNGKVDLTIQRARVDRWAEDYPRLTEGLRDADGRPPRHTFFSPAEIYDPALVEPLAELCRQGLAEVEVHLHHANDTADRLRQTLEHFTRTLADRHGLLSTDGSGRLAYGFIHGNWALDNSLGPSTCGVDNEISVLRETGCYADFTMPSIPHASQSRVVNRVFYAVDDPAKRGSHSTGPIARAGAVPPDGLLMIPGPVALAWRGRHRRWLPTIDCGALDFRTPPLPARLERWLEAGVSVAGRPEWIFIKVHTHGAPERNAAVLLGPGMRQFHQALTTLPDGGSRIRAHYVSAREMANIALAAVDGHSGNPNAYRDYAFRAVSGPAAVTSPAAWRGALP